MSRDFHVMGKSHVTWDRSCYAGAYHLTKKVSCAYIFSHLTRDLTENNHMTKNCHVTKRMLVCTSRDKKGVHIGAIVFYDITGCHMPVI